MKRLFVFLLALIMVLSFAACGSGTGDKSTNDSASASADEAGKTMVVSTPYADLKVPASYEGKVNNKVTSKNPYTVTFTTADSGTELFSIIFNGEDGILLGTIIGESENTVVYIKYAELDQSEENYEDNYRYQEQADTIVNHLKEDYDFVLNSAVEREDDTTFDIETSVVTLKYPARWKSKVNVNVTDDAAEFSCGDVRLFDITFVETDNSFPLGQYNGTPVFLITYELEKEDLTEEEFAELNLMQEDYSVILNNLIKEPDFFLAQNQQSAQ